MKDFLGFLRMMVYKGDFRKLNKPRDLESKQNEILVFLGIQGGVGGVIF